MSERSPYSIIVAPVVSEKALSSNEGKVVVFKVLQDATKHQIKWAVEKIFSGAEVVSVNTVLVKGKLRKYRGRYGREDKVKKAIVRLKDVTVVNEYFVE